MLITQLFIQSQFPESLKFIYLFIHFIDKNTVFQAKCLMSRQNWNLCPSKNVTLASQHISSWKQLGVDGSNFYNIFLL